MKKILISPPFSNIVPSHLNLNLILGTYTLKRRPGRIRVITSLRKIKNGWLNKVGLRNPGITRFKKKNSYVSISLEHSKEWDYFKKILKNKKKKHNIKGLEFNVSCPNYKVSNINYNIIKEAKKIFKVVIIKLPHDITKKKIKYFIELDADYLHISNTKSTQDGAMSGKCLIKKNIENIRFIKNISKQKVIAGGGIYSFKDFKKYYDAGADVFSLSTVFFNPIRSYFLIKKMSQYLR